MLQSLGLVRHFMGQIFNQHPNIFYLFENLRAVTVLTNEYLYLNTPSENYNRLSVKILFEILNCRFRSSVYLDQFMNSFHRSSSKALSAFPLCHQGEATHAFAARKNCAPLIGTTMGEPRSCCTGFPTKALHPCYQCALIRSQSRAKLFT